MNSGHRNRPERRSFRLRHYDYRAPAVCFVTLCAANRRCLFGTIRNGQMQPNELGRLVQSTWGEMPRHAMHVLLHGSVLMPNHLHGVLQIVEPAARPTREAFGLPVAGSLPTLVRSFKAAVTRTARTQGLLGSEPLWQPRYYEHLVRSEEDYRRIAEYMADNPRRWAEDRFHVAGG
ncbi:MAG: hypothetical protein VW877_11720 [Pseudomonadaceae bacterium]